MESFYYVCLFSRELDLSHAYQEIQVVVHVVKQSTHHGSQVYHMCRLHFLEQCLRGNQISKLFIL